jgi:hypothetical protein
MLAKRRSLTVSTDASLSIDFNAVMRAARPPITKHQDVIYWVADDGTARCCRFAAARNRNGK